MAKPEHFRQPRWWTDAHNSAWDHVREAFRAKWELRQEAEPNSEPSEWDDVEPAIRFGFGARRRAPEPEEPREAEASPPDWDPETEAMLEEEWDSMHHSPEEGFMPRLWHDVRQFVHRGWLGP